MKISVIVPVCNAAETLDLCLSAVCGSALEDHEVVVVDDASRDDSVMIAHKYPCRLIELKENQGAAAARNAGARSAGGQVLVFIDSDIVVPPDAIARLVRHLEDPAIAGAIGVYSLKNRFPNFLSQYKHMVVCFRDLMTGDVNQDSFKTAFLALKKEAFQSLEFDETLKHASIEDIEFGRKLIAKGFRFILDKDIQVEHVKKFGVSKYFRNQYQRSRDIGMSYMTARSHKFYLSKARKNAYAKAYVLRAPLGAAFFLLVFLAALCRVPLVLAGAAAIMAVSVVLERQFLGFVRKERGTGFALQCALFYMADGFICSLGVFRAALDLMLKKRSHA
jgi:glycosyltransferase involved in cell wall biosynthesis